MYFLNLLLCWAVTKEMVMKPEIITAVATAINVLLVLWIALITKRYADSTENILNANRESLETLRKTMHGSTFTWAADLLSSTEMIIHRRKLFEELPGYKENLLTMPPDLRDAFEHVCRTYDLVGIACHNGMLSHEIIAKEWGNSLIRLHELCNRHLSELRADRGKIFWNNFTELYESAKKVWN
jgi:hypothetical protein